MTNSIYFDNAATTFPKPEPVIRGLLHNVTVNGASPQRGYSKKVIESNQLLYEVKIEFARLLGTSSELIAFVPSATFGINYALQGLQQAAGKRLNYYSTPFEHNSVARTLQSLRKNNLGSWNFLPIDTKMMVDYDELISMFKKIPPDVVVITHASNVTGDLLPVLDIAKVAKLNGAIVVLDAAQTAGVWFDEIRAIPWDICIFSSHKSLYGIVGSGILALRNLEWMRLAPIIYGGTGLISEEMEMPQNEPDRFEASTKNLLAIRSMLDGWNWINSIGASEFRTHLKKLTTLLKDSFREMFDITTYGTQNNVGIVSFNIDDYKPQEVGQILSHNNITVRSGLHCSPLAHKALDTYPNGTVRVSFSYFNTIEDVQMLIDVVSLFN